MESSLFLESLVGLLWWMIGCLLSRATLLKVYPQLHFSLFRPGGIIFLSGNSVSSLFILLFFSFSSFYGGYSNFCLNTFTSAPLKFFGFNSTRYHLKVFQREAVKVSLCHLAIELHCWAMPELTWSPGCLQHNFQRWWMLWSQPRTTGNSFFQLALSFEKSYLFTSSVLKWKWLKRALYVMNHNLWCTNPLFRFSLMPGTQQLLQTKIHVARTTNKQSTNISQEAQCKCVQATLHSASCTAKIALQPLHI